MKIFLTWLPFSSHESSYVCLNHDINFNFMGENRKEKKNLKTQIFGTWSWKASIALERDRWRERERERHEMQLQEKDNFHWFHCTSCRETLIIMITTKWHSYFMFTSFQKNSTAKKIHELMLTMFLSFSRRNSNHLPLQNTGAISSSRSNHRQRWWNDCVTSEGCRCTC